MTPLLQYAQDTHRVAVKGDALLNPLDELSLKLLATLVKTYQDPKPAVRRSAETRGIDSLHLAIFSGFLPPEALENPRKYRLQHLVIVERLQQLASLSYVTAVDGTALQEGARPTQEGIAYIGILQRPWWRTVLDRFA